MCWYLWSGHTPDGVEGRLEGKRLEVRGPIGRLDINPGERWGGLVTAVSSGALRRVAPLT